MDFLLKEYLEHQLKRTNYKIRVMQSRPFLSPMGTRILEIAQWEKTNLWPSNRRKCPGRPKRNCSKRNQETLWTFSTRMIENIPFEDLK